MALTKDDAVEVASGLLEVRREEMKRLKKIRRYLDGDICQVYSPKRTTVEYRQLVRMSKVNVMPLVVSAFAENLFAEGYRSTKGKTNDAAWELWQDNRMDLRQSLIYRAALSYGLAYATALKKKGGGALIEPYSPLQLTAVYDDPVNDEWPVYAITCSDGYDAATRKRITRINLFDDEWQYSFTKTSESGAELVYDEAKSGEHGLTVCPVVRWVDAGADMDCGTPGEVEPLMELQDQLDNVTYALLIKQQFQAFRQRWVAGMTIEQNPDGSDREPFKAGVDRLFHAESADTKFGEFAEGDLAGLLESRQSTLSLIAVRSQISPLAWLASNGTVANLSADALASLEAAQQRKQAEMKTSFGESNEQLLRLASKANGDDAGFEDRSAQIVWRDTENRSLAQAADALNKLAALNLPTEFIYELLQDYMPNISDQDIQRLKAMAKAEVEATAAAMPPAPPPELLIQQGGAPNAVPAGPAGPTSPPRPAGGGKPARKAVPAGA